MEIPQGEPRRYCSSILVKYVSIVKCFLFNFVYFVVAPSVGYLRAAARVPPVYLPPVRLELRKIIVKTKRAYFGPRCPAPGKGKRVISQENHAMC